MGSKAALPSLRLHALAAAVPFLTVITMHVVLVSVAVAVVCCYPKQKVGALKLPLTMCFGQTVVEEGSAIGWPYRGPRPTVLGPSRPPPIQGRLSESLNF